MTAEGGGHGAGANAILMLRPDGTPMTKREVIKKRRGAFKWLPVLFSNDLVHGSWWMVFASAFSMIFAVLPLIQQYETFYKTHDDLLPAVDFKITWCMLIVSGFFFTVGSWAFLRAFEEPPKKALFHWFRHCQTDELLGAWLFLLGCFPAVPYMLVYFIVKPSFTFFAGTFAAVLMVLGCGLFVYASYPSDKVNKHKNVILPLALRLFGPRIWVIKHLANDWLATMWIFLWVNGLVTFFSAILLIKSLTGPDEDVEQIALWLSGTITAVLFLIGSFYYVAGSYPHAQQFYYAIDRGKQDGELEYDAPANLPDYSSPEDTEDFSNIIFGLGSGEQTGRFPRTNPAVANRSPRGSPQGSPQRDVEVGGGSGQQARNPMHAEYAHIEAEQRKPADTKSQAAASASVSSSIPALAPTPAPVKASVPVVRASPPVVPAAATMAPSSMSLAPPPMSSHTNSPSSALSPSPSGWEAGPSSPATPNSASVLASNSQKSIISSIAPEIEKPKLLQPLTNETDENFEDDDEDVEEEVSALTPHKSESEIALSALSSTSKQDKAKR